MIKSLSNLFASIKTSATGNAPLIKLFTIAIIVIGGSTFITWCIFKSISPIWLPVSAFILSSLILVLSCIIPPEFKTSKSIVCLMLNAPSIKENFSFINADIIPLMEQNLEGCEIVTTHYIKNVFYNIILPTKNGENIIKIKLRDYFYKHCKADMIIIGHAKIDKHDSAPQFSCNCRMILNPNKKVTSEDQKEIDYFISEHETIHISFCLDDDEQKQKCISHFTNIIRVLLNYNPNDHDIVDTIIKILKESCDEVNPIFKETLNQLAVWLINDISNRHPDLAMSKRFIDLCKGYLNKFESVIVLNTKHYYEMQLLLKAPLQSIDKFRNYANSALREIETYHCDDCALLANKAFFNLIINQVEESEKLYMEVFQSISDKRHSVMLEIYNFLFNLSKHQILGIYARYALAYYIMVNNSGADYKQIVKKEFEEISKDAPKGSVLRKFAQNHSNELKKQSKSSWYRII